MILPADQARRIYRGDRSTIRVPVDPRLTATPLRPASRGQSKPFRPFAGDLLPIAQPAKRQGKPRTGWETICHARVTTVQRGPLGYLTDEAAQREGYPTAGEFEEAWVLRHDRAWIDKQVQALIDNSVPEDEALETVPEWAKVRYQHYWAPRQVWTLGIRVEHDLDRFLAAAGQPKGSELGYVLSGDVLGAGVVQPVNRLAKHWTIWADRRYEKARHGAPVIEPWVPRPARTELTLGERLDQALEAKRAAGKSTTSETRLIERKVTAIEQNLRGKAA